VSNFDSLCDQSAPHVIADADALWRATMDVATSRTPTKHLPVAVCSNCEGSGWECYGIGRGDPHFRVCPECGNPEGYECP